MADEVLGEASVVIELDSGSAEASAERLGDKIERILDRATKDAGTRMQRNIDAAVRRITPVKIRVEADLRAFGHSIDTLSNFDPVPLPVRPDIDRAAFEAAIESQLSGLEVSVRVVPDFDQFDAAVGAHRPPNIVVDVDVNNASLNRLSTAVGKVGKAAGGLAKLAGGALAIGTLGIAAAGATQGILALTAALAPAAGLVAALPAVALGTAAAFGALKIALSGVGDAFGAALSGDAAKFNKALEGLSPAAQAAAKEVQALKPAFDDLKNAVQDEFFGQFEGDITRTAQALGGPLQAGLANIAIGWGRAAKGALDYVKSTAGVGNVKSILDASDASVQGLADGTDNLTKGFLSVGASVSDAFGARFGSAISKASSSFGDFLAEAADSGQAVAWVEGALTVLKQLGGVLTNLGGIISGVFQAANSVGGGFLANLKQITGSFNEFVNSAKGQEAIGNIFQTLSSVAAQLGPIFAALVTQVGALAPALAPLFTAIGPAITGLINAIGPAIQGLLPGVQAVVNGLVAAFASISSSGALEAVGVALGQVLAAVAPLLPVIGQLVASLGTVLAPVLTAVAAALTPVIQALSAALLPILPPLTAALVTMANAFAPLLVLIGTTLAQVITAAAPLLTTLTQVITILVAALAPFIEQLTAALLPVLPPIIAAFSAVLNAILPLLPVVAQLVAVIQNMATQILVAIAPALQFAATIASWITINAVVPLIEGLVSVLMRIITAITAVTSGTAGFVPTMIGLFNSLNASISQIVIALASAVGNAFLQLQARALTAVGRLPGALLSLFLQAQANVINTIRSMIGQAISFLAGLPAKAASALSGVTGALVSAGADLIRGMINGIKSMAGALVGAAKSVVGSAVDGAKSLLGIASPSKVFIEIGKFVGQGFIKGLTGTESDIKQAAEQVIGKIREAFKGKNSRLDDVLIAQVQRTQVRLVALAKQREAIAEQIKKANELATSVTSQAAGLGSLQNIGAGTGGVEGIADRIGNAVNKIRVFNRQVNELAKRGLNKDLLGQLIGLGPDAGADLARTLSNATKAQLDDLDEAQKQLAAASKNLGRDSADNLFDAGKQASKGFLAGLKAQQKDVEDLMLTLAKAMAKSIRSALGIKSPSKVFRGIGRYTMDGLELGLRDRVRSVTRTAQGAAGAITGPFGGSVALGSTGGTSGRQAGAQGSSRVVTNNITLTGTGYSEADAQRILNRLAVAAGL